MAPCRWVRLRARQSADRPARASIEAAFDGDPATPGAVVTVRLGGEEETLYAGGMTVPHIGHHLARTLGTELSVVWWA